MSSGHFIPSKTNRVNDIIFVFLARAGSGVLFQNKGFTAGSQLDQRTLAKGPRLIWELLPNLSPCPQVRGKVGKGSLLVQESVCLERHLQAMLRVMQSETVVQSLLSPQSTSFLFWEVEILMTSRLLWWLNNMLDEEKTPRNFKNTGYHLLITTMSLVHSPT